MKKLLTLCLLIPVFVQAQQKRVLFIGNSYTSYNNLPNLFKSVALSFGDSLIVDSNVPGGYTFQQHSGNATTLQKIAQGNWDYVILQAQSQEPSFSPAQVAAQTYPYAKNLCDSIRFYNPCTEPVFYMTWGRKNGDASNCAAYPVICTYEGMQMRLRQSYLEMGDDNNATVAPIGVAWKKVRDTDSTINLYNADGSHPSLWGSYLAACVFYSTLFNKNCQGAWIPASLNADTAQLIQSIASSVVLDSLPKWYLGNLQVPAFSATVNGYTVTFTDNSINPGAVNWEFGDGNSGEGASIQHTYADSGWYSFTHTITNACFSDTNTESIYIAYSPQTALTHPDTQTQLFVRNHQIFVQSDIALHQVMITDLAGRQQFYIVSGHSWQSSELHPGVYLVQLTTADGAHITGKLYIGN
ncbi:MAG: PKD domain-containing protein [Bacteroidota bacterium]